MRSERLGLAGQRRVRLDDLGPPIYFAQSGPQTLRIQTREDGMSIDQVVLSSSAYFSTGPGPQKNDTTILPKTTFAGGSYYVLDVTIKPFAVASKPPGQYIFTLTVDDQHGGAASDTVTVTIVGEPTGGPIDEIVLYAFDTSVRSGDWHGVRDDSAANALLMHNPNRGAAKLAQPLASPSSTRPSERQEALVDH